MKTKMNNKWLFFAKIIGIILGVVLIGYTIYLQVTEKPAIVSNLSIGWSQSKQQFEDIMVPTGVANLRVCGFLDSNREKFLYIHVFDVEDGSFHGKSEGEFISLGKFCSDVKIHVALYSGKYIVKIYDSRKVIASINFEVK